METYRKTGVVTCIFYILAKVAGDIGLIFEGALGKDDSYKLYRLWNLYFDQEDVEQIFGPFGFSKVESVRNLTEGSGPYNDHGVVFIK